MRQRAAIVTVAQAAKITVVDQLVYAVFFGTGDLEGCDKMKQAIWKVAPFGDYRFRGSKLDQLTLLPNEMIDFTILGKTLHDEFKSNGWVKIDEVIEFVKSDATDFHSSHLEGSTLRPMEERGDIEVGPDTRKRKGTYPNGTILRFVAPIQEKQEHQGRLLQCVRGLDLIKSFPYRHCYQVK